MAAQYIVTGIAGSVQDLLRASGLYYLDCAAAIGTSANYFRKQINGYKPIVMADVCTLHELLAEAGCETPLDDFVALWPEVRTKRRR